MIGTDYTVERVDSTNICVAWIAVSSLVFCSRDAADLRLNRLNVGIMSAPKKERT